MSLIVLKPFEQQTLNRRNEQYSAVQELLFSRYNKYHLTLSPRKETSFGHTITIDYLIKSFNFIFDLLNQSLYGKRYKNQGSYINGLVVFENTDKDNPHFHTLIRDPYNDLENRRSVADALRYVLSRVKSSRGNCKDKIPPLIDSKCYLLQEYYNNGDTRLEEYLSKEFSKPTFQSFNDLGTLSSLNADGAAFDIKPIKQY